MRPEQIQHNGITWAKQEDGSVWRWDPSANQWIQWRQGYVGPEPPPKWARAATRQAVRASKEQAKAEEEFRQSPLGQARAAREAGNRFFELVLPVSETSKAWFGDPGMLGAPTATRTIQKQQGHVIEVVESEGWKLEHVGYVFQPTGTMSRDRLLASGQVESIMGQIVGIYLFRATYPNQQSPTARPAPPASTESGSNIGS